MTACYAPGAHFRDPAFGDLEGDDIGAMWRMLTGRATDLKIELHEHEADEETGTAHWIARYTFSTGRPVVNDIQATLPLRRRRPDRRPRRRLRLPPLGQAGPRPERHTWSPCCRRCAPKPAPKPSASSRPSSATRPAPASSPTRVRVVPARGSTRHLRRPYANVCSCGGTSSESRTTCGCRESATAPSSAPSTPRRRWASTSTRSAPARRSTTCPAGATGSATRSTRTGDAPMPASSASPEELTPISTSTPAATSSGRSSSRSTCRSCCGRSWRGRAGSGSWWRWGRTPIPTSGSRAATG